jgi:glycine cleavage system regulatory protein
MKKNTKKVAPKGIINKAVKTTKSVVGNANEYALNTTETVVNGGIEITAQWQTVTEKAIKGGLKLASAQQDLIFDALTSVKKQYKDGKKRVAKLVA